ncbi:MAG TPA: rRNA maturation RNase YbeY, partial [Ruminococcaceae bacterium]|nr:rRNA maturation RNase YbeY [Oscillospiraceae bacterium]
MDKIRVIIDNRQKQVKIPTGIRMLVRRCCNAVLKMEDVTGNIEVHVA